MIQNEPLKRCYTDAGLLTAQAAISVIYACNAADNLNRGHVPDVLAVLKRIQGGFGQYFPAGVEVATVQAATTEAVQHLNGVIQAAAAASGEPTPPELPAPTFKTSEPLNAGQIGILNACIEYVRVSITAALYWTLRLSNREGYEEQARRTLELFEGAREVIPLTPDDEREAAAALVPFREHVEGVRAALNIPDFPDLTPREINARNAEIWHVLGYLTEPVNTTEQAARMLNEYRDIWLQNEARNWWGMPLKNSWDLPQGL